jgi:hypothetical protein
LLNLLTCFFFVRNKDESLNEITKRKKLAVLYGHYVAILTLIFWNVHTTTVIVWRDLNLEMSSSKAFGEFLNTSESYRDAIIVPEPDYLLESLPYYADSDENYYVYAIRSLKHSSSLNSKQESW